MTESCKANIYKPRLQSSSRPAQEACCGGDGDLGGRGETEGRQLRTRRREPNPGNVGGQNSSPRQKRNWIRLRPIKTTPAVSGQREKTGAYEQGVELGTLGGHGSAGARALGMLASSDCNAALP